jgi:hypothetical protein
LWNIHIGVRKRNCRELSEESHRDEMNSFSEKAEI